MKKTLFYSVLMLVTVMFAACEKEKETTTGFSLEGKWKMTAIKAVLESDGEVIDLGTIDLTSVEYSEDYPINWEFLKDGHMKIDGEDIEATYVLSEDESKLVISEDGEVAASYDVHKVSNKEIELIMYFDEEYGKVTQTCVLKKQ